MYHETGAMPVVGATRHTNHASSSRNPQSQIPIPSRSNPTSISYTGSSISVQSHGQIPGQYAQVQAGDISQMSAGRFAFMKEQMAWMKQKMNSEFGGDTEVQNPAGSGMFDDDDDGEMSAGISNLTIETRTPRSALVHGSSSTAVWADESPRTVIITGDHTEVDRNVYQTDWDSHKVQNNFVKDSFGGSLGR